MPTNYQYQFRLRFECLIVLASVVEPFHYGPAPAPASQDGGSGSGQKGRLRLHNTGVSGRNLKIGQNAVNFIVFR